jgi:hypothetical protein
MGYLKLVLIVDDKPLGRRGVGWHTMVCYGGPEWFRLSGHLKRFLERLTNHAGEIIKYLSKP